MVVMVTILSNLDNCQLHCQDTATALVNTPRFVHNSYNQESYYGSCYYSLQGLLRSHTNLCQIVLCYRLGQFSQFSGFFWTVDLGKCRSLFLESPGYFSGPKSCFVLALFGFKFKISLIILKMIQRNNQLTKQINQFVSQELCYYSAGFDKKFVFGLKSYRDFRGTGLGFKCGFWCRFQSRFRYVLTHFGAGFSTRVLVQVSVQNLVQILMQVSVQVLVQGLAQGFSSGFGAEFQFLVQSLVQMLVPFLVQVLVEVLVRDLAQVQLQLKVQVQIQDTWERCDPQGA